jgi:hypothetical protein
MAVRALVRAPAVRCTDRVKRVITAITAIATLLLLPACGHPSAKDTAATRAPSGSSAAASAGSTTAPSALRSGSLTPTVGEFTVDGAGPYQIGAMLTDLQATPGLTNVTTGGQTCPTTTTAQGTGVWKDLHLSFHQDGTLYLAVNRSPTIPTPSGAWLGTTLAQLKTIYAKVQTEQLTAGTGKAFLVTTLSGRGILFDLNAQGAVISMAAADASYLRTGYHTGTGLC